MIIQLNLPPSPLADSVEWIWEQTGPPPAHPEERIVPSGTLELVIALHEEPIRITGRTVVHAHGAVVCGPQTAPIVIGTAAQGALVGVHFRPGGAWPFFTVPIELLTDALVPLDLLWGAPRVRELRQCLAEARPGAERAALVAAALVERLSVRRRPGHPAVAFAVRAIEANRPGMTIGALVAESGLSSRRFIELFRREIGLAPKLFGRMRRLQTVLRRIEDVDGSGWTALALEHGYFDQPHLIRDFHDFVGCAPGAFRPLGSGQRNHVALPEMGSNSSRTPRPPRA